MSIESSSIKFDCLLYLINRIRITTIKTIIMNISQRMIPRKTIFLSEFFSFFFLLFSIKVLVTSTSKIDSSNFLLDVKIDSSKFLLDVKSSLKYLVQENIELGEKKSLVENEELSVNLLDEENSELHE